MHLAKMRHFRRACNHKMNMICALWSLLFVLSCSMRLYNALCLVILSGANCMLSQAMYLYRAAPGMRRFPFLEAPSYPCTRVAIGLLEEPSSSTRLPNQLWKNMIGQKYTHAAGQALLGLSSEGKGQR